MVSHSDTFFKPQAKFLLNYSTPFVLIIYLLPRGDLMFETLLNLLHELIFLAGYIGGTNAFPKQLSPEDENKYLTLYKNGDQAARNVLIEHNLRLVAHIAKKYSNENNTDDLISVGIIGLIKGINTFSPEKNPRLVTYIARCIENEILMVLRSSKKHLGEVSLDEPIGVDKEGNNMTFSDILPADNTDIIEDIALKSDVKRLYETMHKVLSENELNIISWRYGLNNAKRKTQKEVAEILGISRSYVSRRA